jgi:NAD(P)-dependent dehydrogenase (short-subunit alcohol dehydrogenase family)
MSQKVAYVTGGMGGIGTAICQRLAKDGFKVIAGCGPNSPRKDRWIGEQKALGYDFIASEGNVSDWDSTVAAFDKVKAEVGRVDVLVNNAGIAGPTAAIEDTTLNEWQQTLDVNLTGAFLCTRSAVPLIKKAKGGSIINISSAAGRHGFPLRSPYSATKFGVIGLTQTWAMELGPSGIRVNAILPGIVEGARQDRVLSAKAETFGISLEAMRTRALERVSLRRMVSAQDIAAQIVFVCSPAGANVSGQSLSVDGNMETLAQ